jgi:hypothetical protein
MPNSTNRLIYRAFQNGGTVILHVPNNKIIDYSFLLWGSAPTLTDVDIDQEDSSEMHPFMIAPMILVILI